MAMERTGLRIGEGLNFRNLVEDKGARDADFPDPKASEDHVRWYCVDVVFGEKFPAVLPLKSLKQMPGLENMVLLKQGRLSVQPVTAAEWRLILRAAS